MLNKDTAQKKTDQYMVFFLLFFLTFLLWGFQSFFYYRADGVNMSEVLALNWINAMGLQWGQDVAFTYGPLYKMWGFLSPFFSSQRKFLEFHILMNVIKAAIKAFLAVSLIKTGDIKRNAALIAICFFSLIVFTNTNQSLLELTLIFAYTCFMLWFQFYRQNLLFTILVNIPIGFAFSVSFLTKFGYFYVTCVGTIIMCCVYIICKKIYAVPVLIASVSVFTSILWLITGQRISNLSSWILSSISISGGYTEAMRLKFTNPIRGFSIFILALFILLSFTFALFFFLKRKTWVRFLGLFLIAPQLFLLFKEAFVRSDGHENYFLNNWPIILFYCLFVFCQPCQNNENTTHTCQFFNHPRTIATSCALLLFITMQFSELKVTPNNMAYLVFDTYNNYPKVTDKANLRNIYHSFGELDKFIDKENDVIDIIPWDISLLYAYEYNWKPRYTLQSYTNYTAYLDKITAQKLSKEEAPNKIIYSLKTIDRRYAIFDEPETLKVLLFNYQVIAGNNDYLILERKGEPGHSYMPVIETNASLNESFVIPEHNDGYMFAEIDWKPTFFGKLMNFLFKSPQNIVAITLKDGTIKEHIFIRNVAENGLFVSKYISSNEDFSSITTAAFVPDIESITIKGNPLFYNSDFNVRFVFIPK